MPAALEESFMKYHFTAGSMLGSVVDVGEEFLAPLSCPSSRGSESDFSPYGFTPPSAHCTLLQIERAQTSGALNATKAEHCVTEHSDHTRFNRFTRSAGHIPLTAIFEHDSESLSKNLGASQISFFCEQQGAQTAHTTDSVLCYPPTSPASGNPLPALTQTKTSLIRHSSSPAGFLCRLVLEPQCQTERCSDCFSGPLLQAPVGPLSESAPMEEHFTTPSTFDSPNSFGSVIDAVDCKDDINGQKMPATPNRHGLLRQNSSPAGLLSQMPLEGTAEGGEKFISTSCSGNSSEEGGFERRGGNFPGVPFANMRDAGIVMDAMQNNLPYPSRKRVRERQLDVEPVFPSLPDFQQTDVLERGFPLVNHFSLPTATSTESQMTMDKTCPPAFVPCRERAKRGCATHPRSIAERVRRTKISERMKKLQDLVPNMDKQTNTADMLDEAVEYIKCLQRQVQELLEGRVKCDGTCKQNLNGLQS